ncbi:DUF2461 domain-containing protein [Virgisporangium ochraceum]|uniref:TIGR02453 family protein n=1 Tax=Virgisporangium ochraceum TaxID=65505 RepID=A0A8J3ZKT9_9ACTN|nr:DUF2461 domain-containing protein [Virgisporangium ochraceum]GIJ65927.1 TIGR02453 family protein [Virgisporangium ochraceum]
MAFTGWPAEALDFYEGLAADNSKSYWTEHKATYDDKVYAPMVALLADLEPEFGAGKIFRPYRDVRFSSDKSPYKTTIAATLEKGGYVQLSADGLACGRGYYWMASDQLARYRAAVAEDRTGKDLEAIIAAAAKKKISITGHEQLKTAPRGYPKDHPRVDLLRNKGLVAWQEWPPAAWLGTAKAKDRVVAFLHATDHLAEWLDTNVGESR